MAMFDFGARRKVIDSRGTEKDSGELALHVQCAWRITRGARILVGSRDIHYPSTYSEGQEISNDFDWERDTTRLDALLQALFDAGTKEFVVQRVEVGDAGKFIAVLSGELSLEVFPDDSLPLEHWRLFIPQAHQPHFVVAGENS